ncbi:unnamed protein product [Urochloa decumbens]|uniref:F-box domain-containing protein n=1 Tax=Urochloa decumbens TaxID=240449 RepID=A0ABC8XD78_9POAL
MSEDNGEIPGGGKQRRSSPVPASPIEDENVLSVILHRLPSLPPSLLRASLVNKSWQSIVSHPRFLRDFRAHHKNPPLLGLFSYNFRGNIEFTTVLGPKDSIPAERFNLPIRPGSRVLRSHHGRVLAVDQGKRHFLVWDPVAREQLNISYPPALGRKSLLIMDGGVVCAATEKGHVHGACHSDPFKLVFIGADRDRFFACVYSSETGAWGNLFAIMQPQYIERVCTKCPSTMLGNSICMLLVGQMAVILQFDWDRGNLGFIDIPSDAHLFDAILSGRCYFMITPADSGGLNFYLLSDFSVYIWKRVLNHVGAARWIFGNIIELGSLLSLKPPMSLNLLGVDEDKNVILRLTDDVVFTVNLESMEFQKMSTQLPFFSFTFHAFKSFYMPGTCVSAGQEDVKSLPGA